MPGSQQLSHLIGSYFREEPDLQQQLRVLDQCQLGRFWFTLRIDCPNRAIADQVCSLISAICEPIGLLRLARRVRVRCLNGPVRTFTVQDQLPVSDSSDDNDLSIRETP